MTEAERQEHRSRIEAMQAQRGAELAQRNEEASHTAKALWAQAAPAPADHPYLVRKGVHPRGTKVDSLGTLLVPMHDTTSKLWNIERIPAEDGAPKKGLPGGKRKGCYFGMGKPNGKLVLAEGFATGASIHECTGDAVAVCFNAGNVQAVAQALRSKYPELALIVAADDDHKTDGNPGITAAKAAAQAVGALLAVPVFGADRPDKATDFNDLHQLQGADAVRQCFDNAINPVAAGAGVQGVTAQFDLWPELVPLADDSGDCTPPKPFPFEALGEVLGSAAQAIAETVQAPDAMAGGSVLAAASLAVQHLADVRLPHGQVTPLSTYILSACDSGDRKSVVDAVSCGEIGRRRKEQARKHHHAMEAFRAEQGTRQKGDPEPQEPLLQSLTVGNATVEGVSRLLKNQSSVGVFSPEGGEVLGGHSMKDANRMGAMAFFLKAWSAESLDVMRGGAGFTSLLGRRVALHVMVQPILLRQLLSDPLADGQGFLARCLIAQPESLAGHRPFNGDNPAEHPAVQAYAQRMGQLLDTKAQLYEGGDGYELDPRALSLSADARALWVAFYNAIEAEQADGKELAHARAFASKAAEQAARIAGVITLFNDPGALEVGASAMDGAMEVMKFYLGEHLRLMGTGKQEQADSRLRTLLDWMQLQGHIVSNADVQQKCPRLVRKLKTKGIKLLLEELKERGYIRPIGKAWEVRHGV
jgi:putative DNA primase/helicase